MPDHDEQRHATQIVVHGRIEHCLRVDGSDIGPIHVHLHDDGKAGHAEILKAIGEMMSKISDFVTKQNAHNDKIDASIKGISDDVAAQKDLIAKLQASQGDISTEDQVSLDALDTRNQSIADKLDALDALTPPVAPTTP